MTYTSIKECYYSPYSLDQTAGQVLDVLKSNKESGVDVKGQEGLDYFDFYEKLVYPLPSTFNMLHINVKKGYSIVSWLRRFPNCRIVAVEKKIDEWKRTEKYFGLRPEEKFRLRVIETNPESSDLHLLLKDEEFDIILDHGHRDVSKRISLFNTLYPTLLKPDGLYIMEDTFCQDGKNLLVKWAQGMIPYTYKFPDWEQCTTLYGRRQILDKIKKNWKYTLAEITFHRNIIVLTKESMMWSLI